MTELVSELGQLLIFAQNQVHRYIVARYI
jgi:hypothetical protein